MITKSFGKRLRRLREERGLTREKLGEAISVTSTSIYNVERGEQWIGPELLGRLSDYFNVNPAAFFTDEVVKIMPTPQEALAIISEALSTKTAPTLPGTEDFDDREMAMLEQAILAIRESRSFGKASKKRENHS